MSKTHKTELMRVSKPLACRIKTVAEIMRRGISTQTDICIEYGLTKEEQAAHIKRVLAKVKQP